jgi:hypothetical protein
MFNEYPKNDNQFEDKVLSEVKKFNDSYELKFNDGWCFSIDNKSGIIPKVGDSIRTYGKGIGFTIRGFFVNGKKVYYRTESQQEQKHKNWCKKERKKKVARLASEKDDRDKRVKALPESMQKRMQGFYERNKDFRIEFEPYELFCLEQAMIIANACKMETSGNHNFAIDETFKKLTFDEQKKLVPEISDQHSGNTFGFSCLMAKFLLQGNDEYIIKNHGALCPMVGCSDYGCWSTTQKEK